MNRRDAVIALLALGIMPLPAPAQSVRKMYRVGLLYNNKSVPLEELMKGLRDLGYIEGQNVLIERRTADGQPERLANLAVELTRLEVDIIVAPDPPSTYAAKAATKTIPIVMRSTGDPVELGLVASLAHPGGNITGVYSLYAELTPKRLELLKAAIPGLTHVAVLWDPNFPGARSAWKYVQTAAKVLGLKVTSIEVHREKELDGAFAAAAAAHVGALVTLRSPLFVVHRTQIVALAKKYRLASIYDERQFIDAGGLMAYGANMNDLYRHIAIYADRILKGAKPGDLPVEQPTKFELVINLKTAKALGLTIPPSLLQRADEVIQ
jgi:putative ABC transport system substrate-binding protein